MTERDPVKATGLLKGKGLLMEMGQPKVMGLGLEKDPVRGLA